MPDDNVDHLLEIPKFLQRDYYAGDKSRFAVWSKRDTPKWYTDRMELASA